MYRDPNPETGAQLNFDVDRINLHDDGERQVDLAVINTEDVPISKVLETLHLTNDFRWKDDMATDDAGGTWQKFRKGKTLRFSVCVGCYCQRDCCGHLCGLEYSLSLNGKYLTIISERAYNY